MKLTQSNEYSRTLIASDLNGDLKELKITIGYVGDSHISKGSALDAEVVPTILSKVNDDWIKIEDELPPEGELVYLYHPELKCYYPFIDKTMIVGSYVGGLFYDHEGNPLTEREEIEDTGTPTHWRKIPGPPTDS